MTKKSSAQEHLEWLERHIRALAEHRAERAAKEAREEGAKNAAKTSTLSNTRNTDSA
jgi:hypothetical protein